MSTDVVYRDYGLIFCTTVSGKKLQSTGVGTDTNMDRGVIDNMYGC